MFRVEAAELEGSAGFREVQVGPPLGAAFLEDPGGRGEVDEVEAVAGEGGPVVGVAEDVGFDLLAAVEEVEEGLGVGQAGELLLRIFPVGVRALVGVVVGEDEGGLVGVGVEGL
jgi:hypothetical protein